jgi:adenylosuccinate synthase
MMHAIHCEDVQDRLEEFHDDELTIEERVAIQSHLRDCVTCSLMAADFDDLRRVQPVYESLPGWKEDITACRTFEELPKNARDYITYIEDLAEVPVSMIAVGPEREQTIMRRWEGRA